MKVSKQQLQRNQDARVRRAAASVALIASKVRGSDMWNSDGGEYLLFDDVGRPLQPVTPMSSREVFDECRMRRS